MLQDSGAARVRMSASHHGQLAGGKFRMVVFQAREQMPVHVEGHLYRAMAEQRLQPLRREAPLDRPGREEMPQPMQAVFRPPLPVYDPRGFLDGVEAPVGDVGM